MTLTEAEDLLTQLRAEGQHLERREAMPRHADGWTLEGHEGYCARSCACGQVYIVARSRKDIKDCGAWMHMSSR